jgi:predicted Zn-dependent peptidase
MNTLKTFIVGMAAGVLSLGAVAQSDIEFTEFTLDNGLHVILHEDHSTPIVAISVLYHVGSKNEDPERTGFAHFFEHLLFEGTEHIGRGEYMEIIQSNGGALNANTSADRTFYYEILPSNQLELGLWMESERMLHAKIDQVGVDTQREVVKEEKRQRIDNQPYATFTMEMFKRAFTVHPYNWVPIGSLDHLNAAQLEEFIDFYKTFYVPNNATLSIAGDIDVKETRAMIEKYFGDIPAGTNEIPRPDVEEPALAGPIVDTIYDNIQLPATFWGYRIPKQTDPDAYALEVLTTLLSGGASSRMSTSLVDDQQLALQVFSFPYTLEDAGLFIVLGLPQMDKDLAQLEAGMQAEIDRVKNELVSEREFEKVMNQIESDFISGYSSVAGKAEALANYHVYYGDADLINNELERYRSVTREDLMRVAKKYLNESNRVVLRYLPAQTQSSNAQ